MGSLAAETRNAVAESPFLRDALRAGVVNFAAAARYLDVDGDEEAVATALRRYTEELPPLDDRGPDVRVRMESGVEPDILAVSGTRPAGESSTLTAIVASGELDPPFVGRALVRMEGAEVTVHGAGVADGTAVFLVERRDGATALRLVEQGVA